MSVLSFKVPLKITRLSQNSKVSSRRSSKYSLPLLHSLSHVSVAFLVKIQSYTVSLPPFLYASEHLLESSRWLIIFPTGLMSLVPGPWMLSVFMLDLADKMMREQ